MAKEKKWTCDPDKECKCHCEEETETESICVDFDEERFQQGVNDVSRLCGKIAALSSIGVSPEAALQYFSGIKENQAVAENNLAMARLNAETQVAIARETAYTN